MKGTAAVSSDAKGRQPEVQASPSKANAPLNFKVDPEFRRRFKQRAAEADLKLNALLRDALEAWEEKQGLKNSTKTRNLSFVLERKHEKNTALLSNIMLFCFLFAKSYKCCVRIVGVFAMFYHPVSPILFE